MPAVGFCVDAGTHGLVLKVIHRGKHTDSHICLLVLSSPFIKKISATEILEAEFVILSTLVGSQPRDAITLRSAANHQRVHTILLSGPLINIH